MLEYPCILQYDLNSISASVKLASMSKRDNLTSADNQQERLKRISRNIGHYLAGFADGEGSFNISLVKRNLDYKYGWKIVASFNISQRDPTIPILFKETLGCGTIRYRRDGVCYFEVRRIDDLNIIVRKFFEKFPIQSHRQASRLRHLLQDVDLIARQEHLNPKGFKDVLSIREKMLSNRPRTYNMTDAMKNPQRLHARH